MSDNFSTVLERLPVEGLRERRIDPKLLRWFELGLVLSIAFSHSLIGSIDILLHGRSVLPVQPGMTWTAALVQEMACLLLLAYVLSRRKIRFKDLGLRWSLWDIPKGIGLAVGAYLTYAVSGMILFQIQRHFFPSTTSGVLPRDLYGHMTALTVPFLLLNPFFEELIVRAYLITEVRQLTGSGVLAVAMSTVLQTSYHLYYGWPTALALGFQFLLLSVYYARTRKILPVIITHEMFDLVALLQHW